jgi:BioD-like phosphotransacetylase family protein
MATVYIGSTETFVGKSATCVGILDHARRDGFSVGYMKPVSVSVTPTESGLVDEDASFIREHFGLSDPIERMAPVLMTQAAVEQYMRGKVVDVSKRLRDAYAALARDKDLVVLEGANTWAEGSIFELSADQVADMLQAPVLMVARYRSVLTLDTITAVQRYLGDHLLGVILNQIDEPKLSFVRQRVTPYLEQRGVPVFATLVEDSQLAGVSVADLYDFLGGQMIGLPEWSDKLVEHLMIGAMGPEAALSYFRRRAGKAVITGGDRTDIQMAALETSTSVLVLTGNVRPIAQVIDRAEERGVPIILVADDTMTTVDRAEQIFGHIRFKQAGKIRRYIEMLDEQFDFQRLYDKIGLGAH